MSLPLAFAQSLPDPTDELRRQGERTQVQRQREEKSVDIRSTIAAPDTSPIPTNESPCFPIKHLQLQVQFQRQAEVAPTARAAPSESSANLWVPSFEWARQAIAGPKGDDSPIGKCVGASGIALIIKRAQDSVVARGYVTTRILAQQQDLREGTLTLTVLPGRMSDIRFKSDDHTLVRTQIEPAKDSDVGVVSKADGQIYSAQSTDGQSDPVISYQQQFPARFSVSLDDSGSKGTGKYQGSATVSLDSPLRLIDLFYITANHDLGGGDDGSRGTQGHTVHYSLPLGYWMLGTTYSSSRYFQSVAGASQKYIYSGTSEDTELKLSRLVYRDAVRKTALILNGWQRKRNTYVDDTKVLVQRRVVGGWELRLNHKDAINSVSGEITLEASFAYKRGTSDFDTMPAPEEINISASEPTGVFKMGLRTLDLSASVHVQDNTTPLTPQDRMSIGWTLRNDWGLALDAGEVSGPSEQYLRGITLSGGVVGVRGGFKKMQYDLFVGGSTTKPEGFMTAQTTPGFSLSLGL